MTADLRHRPRRRLRCPVRPAHRAAGARGARLLRDRPSIDAARPRCSPASREGSSSPAGRARSMPHRRPRSTRRCSARACPCSASATAPSCSPSCSAARSPAPARLSSAAPPLFARAASVLMDGWPASTEVWMSHADSIVERPPGFAVTAATAEVAVAALEDRARAVYGVQFHPEVVHTERGQELLERFLFEVCGCRPLWTTRLGHRVTGRGGPRPRSDPATRSVALSGGVDSAVAAALVHKAIGDQLTAVFVDTGLMRAGEGEQVEATFLEPVRRRSRAREGGRPILRGLGGRDRPRGEAQGHRASCSSASSRRSRSSTKTPSSSCRAPCTPT